MKENTRKIIKWISNGTFGLAIIFAVIAVIDFFITRSQLPPGACPLTGSRTWLYPAIALSLIALVLSFFDEKPERK